MSMPGVGFQAPFGPGYMPAGVPRQTSFAYQGGPNPVFGSGGLPTQLPTGAPGGGGGGGFSIPTSLGEAGDLAKRGLGWLAKNPEVGLAVLGAVQGYRAQKDASQNDQRALDLLEQRQQQLAPLSARGIAGIMGGQRPDTSYLVDPSNPYAATFAPVGQVGGGGGGAGATTRTRARRG